MGDVMFDGSAGKKKGEGLYGLMMLTDTHATDQ